MSPEETPFGVGFFELGSRMNGESARKDGDVEVLALLNHASANQRHQMLPTDQAADAADFRFVGDEVAPVPPSPDRALDEGWHRLSMTPQNLPGAVEEEQGVVDGVDARARVHFIAAEYHVGVCLGRGLAQALGILAGNQQGIVIEPDTNRNPVLQVGIPALAPVGVSGHPRFGENNQFGAVASRFSDLLAGAVDAFSPVEENRRRLHDGDAHRTASTENLLFRLHRDTSHGATVRRATTPPELAGRGTSGDQSAVTFSRSAFSAFWWAGRR